MAAAITEDPRFQLARALVSGRTGGDDAHAVDQSARGGGPEAAVGIFATLLELCEARDGTGPSAALCQYEYGNALFRAVVRRSEASPSDDDRDAAVEGADGERKRDGDRAETEDRKPAAEDESRRERMAAAALKRAPAGSDAGSPSRKRFKLGNVASMEDSGPNRDEDGSLPPTRTGDEDGDEEDLSLALEMMEMSFGKFLIHAADGESSATNEQQQRQRQRQWARGQLPRVLVCIGDLHSHRGDFGDAVDAYCRALPYREEAWEGRQRGRERRGEGADPSSFAAEDLRCQRLLIETYVLVAEGLLAGPPGKDVACRGRDDGGGDEDAARAATAARSNGEKGRVLVPARERIHVAESHYALAREGLEELLVRYGKMAAAGAEVGGEKEDIAYLVVLVSGLGNSIKYEH